VGGRNPFLQKKLFLFIMGLSEGYTIMINFRVLDGQVWAETGKIEAKQNT